MYRFRRLRRDERIRSMMQETRLHPKNFIYPVFVIEGEKIKNPVASMPGVFQYSVDRLDEIMEQVKEVLSETDLSSMVHIIEQKLMEEDYTSLDVAAALLKLSMGEENEDIAESGRLARSLDELDRYGWDGRDNGRNSRGRKGRGTKGVKNGREGRGDMVRLFVNIGKNQNVKPGDILGAIAGESGIPGRMVGSIDMYDKYTFVEVPGENADVVMKAMKHVKIKGKSIHMEAANVR